MLKILEEPPEYVIFIICTTNPEKMLSTVLSRVQRFNFQKISNKGIKDRLLYILQNENIQNYEEQAIDYITRLAKGGMRDAITTLDKCLDYDKNISLDNVLKVTSGGVTEEDLSKFMYYIVIRDAKQCILHLNSIYMTGIDMNLFYKLLFEFLTNCCKYLVVKTRDIVPLSDKVIDWLAVNTNNYNLIKQALIELKNLYSTSNSEDLKILLESWIIEICT